MNFGRLHVHLSLIAQKLLIGLSHTKVSAKPKKSLLVIIGRIKIAYAYLWMK